MTHTHPDWHPGPYTLGKLLGEVATQLPELLRSGGHLVTGLTGPHRLPGSSRMAVQLRMARILGCPVCAKLFPPLGSRAGLSPEAVQSALAGAPDALTPEQYGAVVWAGDILQADGTAPFEVPEPALALTAPQRDHLLFMMRLELVVHSTGLMFLPHGMVERATRV